MKRYSSPVSSAINEKYIRYHLKSLKFVDSNKLEKAQKQLEGLSQLNYKPNLYEVMTLNNLAVVYMKQKYYNKAMITLIKALIKVKSLHSIQDHIGTLLNLSAATSSLGIHSDALNYCNEAISLLKGTSEIKLILLAYYNASVEFIFLNRNLEAEDLLKKAISLFNDHKMNDPKFFQIILNTLNSITNKKEIIPAEKNLGTNNFFGTSTRKRQILKKNFSSSEISSILNPIEIKVKKVEKSAKPEKKRDHSNRSSRIVHTTCRKHEKSNNSGTSSTESIGTSSKTFKSSLNSSKTLKKFTFSEKSSHISTPSANNHSQIIVPEYENRINSIGDHLNSIEKKLNDFAELCRPLKILTEDPEEQLDSYRNSKYSLKSIVFMQRIAKKRFFTKNKAAITIQRAFRNYRSHKLMKNLIKFKDNPLFKQFKYSARTGNRIRKINKD